VQIQNVANRVMGAVGLERRPDSAEVHAAAAGGAAPLHEAGLHRGDGPQMPSARFRELLARYDVRDISPREFSRLAHELYDAGEISESEYRQLGQIRMQLDLAGVDPDRSLDLLAWVQQQMEEHSAQLDQLEQIDPQPAHEIAQLRSALDRLGQQAGWIHRFALIQQGGPEAGVNQYA
jgi:hypothetical protein